jgi:hypothetical protein
MQKSVILEHRKSNPASPSEVVPNPFDFIANDAQQDESQPISIEVEEETTKIIQKETVQTGSVSYFLRYDLILSDSTSELYIIGEI